MRWKSAASLVGLAILFPGLALAQGEQDATTPAYSFVATQTNNSFNSAEFPVYKQFGFAKTNAGASLSVDGENLGITWRVRALLSKEDVSSLVREVRVKELNKVWAISDQCLVSAGKRILAWDVGYLAQPVGFFQTQTVLTDLLDVAGNSEGLPLVLYSCALDKSSAIDIVYSNDFSQKTIVGNRGMRQSVARLSGNLGKFSYSVLARHVDGKGSGFGATSTLTIGEQFELHGSVYAQNRADRVIHVGLEKNALAFWKSDPYVLKSNEHISTQALFGATFTPRDMPAFLLEVSHNDKGLSRSEWRQWRDMVEFHQTTPIANPFSVTRSINLLWDLRTINQQGTLRDYAYLQMQGSLGDFDYNLGSKLGLNDKSKAIFFSLRREITKTSFVALSLSHFAKVKGTEFAYFPIPSAVTVRLGYSF